MAYYKILSSPCIIESKILQNSTKLIMMEINLALSVYITSVYSVETTYLLISFLDNYKSSHNCSIKGIG